MKFLQKFFCDGAVMAYINTLKSVHDCGNLASETRPGAITASATYDGYARLIGYARTGEATLAFTYNGMDDRVREVRGTATRRYLYDGSGRVMGEYGASATDVIAETLWLSPDAANDRYIHLS